MNQTSILVAVSDVRDPAFDRALALARRSAAVVHVFHPIPADVPFSFRAAERLAGADTLRARARAAGVTAHLTERHGDPAVTITQHADASAVGLIVLTADRRTGWSPFGGRPVVERVLRRAKQPVLVVPRNGKRDSPFERVLLATDLSRASGALIDRALELLGDGPRVTVLHAVDSLEAKDALLQRARWVVPEYRGHVLAAARHELESVVGARADRDTEVATRLVAGPADTTINATAAAIDADLIVLGASRRFMHVGSVVTRLLHGAGRPLLVLPHGSVSDASRTRARDAARVA